MKSMTKIKVISIIVFIVLIFTNLNNIAYGLIISTNLYFIYIFYKKSRFYYNVPYYNKALKGVYVKFLGKVEVFNNLNAPVYKTACEFYKFKIKALWQVKAPKPSRGYITETKPLGSGNSGKPFLVSDGKKKVFVDNIIPDGKIAKLDIHKEVIDKRSPIKGYPSQAKFETYRYINRFLKAGDLITVYGRLIKSKDKFILTNSNQEKLPFMVLLGDRTKFGSFYLWDFMERFTCMAIATSFFFFFRYPDEDEVKVLIFLAILLIIGPITILRNIKKGFNAS